ncbi:lipoprotein [Streptomyces griseus]|uniref:lipoprotein n=1 Tax=Streptomyces griseus TaxID=1911 RepID=UPI00055FB6E4|nr:lipoprotein [Streptomyces griseus]
MKTAVRGATHRRVAGAGLAALLLAAGATGCGTEKSPEMSPVAAVAKAAKKTESISSLRWKMTGVTPEEGHVEAEAAMRQKPLAMSMKVSTPDDPEVKGAVEIRVVGKALYIGGDAMAGEMDGKSWMKLGTDKRGGADNGMSSDSKGLAQANRNPTSESAFLTGAKDIEKVGTETIDGVKTTHYKGTATLDDLRASFKGKDKATRERREKSIKQYEKMGVDSLVMDMWVDGDDHTKRFRMRGDADKGKLDLTLTFVDFNKPVTITAPPAKDTVDLAEMMKGLDKA